MAQATISNAERKRVARTRALVEQQRAQKAQEGSITAFRTEELYWKNRTTEPNWELAFRADNDSVQWIPATSQDDSAEEVQYGSWTDRRGHVWTVQKWTLENGKIACCFPDNPGLIVLPDFLNVTEQQRLITSALYETTGPASRSNLDSHYHAPELGWWKQYVQAPQEIVKTRASGQILPEDFRPSSQRVQVDFKPMDTVAYKQDQNHLKEDPVPSCTVQSLPAEALVRKLRWTIIGLEYHWGTKSYKWDKPPMPMPQVFRETCQSVALSVPWSKVPLAKSGTLDTSDWQNYQPEAGVVNFYQYRDSLTAHVDQSEVDSVRPLISISLGESCIFLAGGPTRNETPIPFLLRSGDVIIMAGEGRRVFHGVPRVIEGGCRTQFDWSQHRDGEQMSGFMKGTRMNVNVRQVFSEKQPDACFEHSQD